MLSDMDIRRGRGVRNIYYAFIMHSQHLERSGVEHLITKVAAIMTS